MSYRLPTARMSGHSKAVSYRLPTCAYHGIIIQESTTSFSQLRSSVLLETMNPNDSDWSLETKPSKHLNVIVVGAGIAGLTASLALRQIGHHVILLEQSCVISEVGAGIQMAPNNMRILQRLGILPKVLERCNLLNRISLRRWQNNEELGRVPLMPTVAER